MEQDGRRRGRNETEEERADRMWGELIQEVRVAQTGVQILFGFLLTVVFQPKYARLGDTDQIIYIVTVVLGSCTTGALIGPVSLHRLVSGRRVKPQAVRLASRMTFVGLALLLATMTSALLLVLRVAMRDSAMAWLVAAVVAWYVLCWYGLPLWARRRHTSRGDGEKRT
jgi:O-antigen/teichoic acid export membrane protein